MYSPEYIFSQRQGTGLPTIENLISFVHYDEKLEWAAFWTLKVGEQPMLQSVCSHYLRMHRFRIAQNIIDKSPFYY